MFISQLYPPFFFKFLAPTLLNYQYFEREQSFQTELETVKTKLRDYKELCDKKDRYLRVPLPILTSTAFYIFASSNCDPICRVILISTSPTK